jgi:hypothetical protein
MPSVRIKEEKFRLSRLKEATVVYDLMKPPSGINLRLRGAMVRSTKSGAARDYSELRWLPD